MQRSNQHVEDEATRFLLSRVDFERTTNVPYPQRDFRLDRMRRLLARLGDPQHALSIVHIAGTKGKGSTAATIASILRAAGYRTGLYSSPHLDRVEERLAIDGEPCPAHELADLVQRIRPAVESMDREPVDGPSASNRPTYFEIITALALLRFAEHRVEAAVLEVGLGGRLDSTNVCQPLVSVITSISFDHMQQLGNTLASIAREKAGIIKAGVPVVSGVTDAEPREMIADIARERDSRLIELSRDFDFQYTPPRDLQDTPSLGSIDFQCRAAGLQGELRAIELSLVGKHQAANAAVALVTIFELIRQGWKIDEQAIRRGLAQVSWPARVELIGRHPAIILDAAHNRASVEALVASLAASFSPSPRLAIFGTSRDKDARGMLEVLLPKFDEVILTQYVNNPRAVRPEKLDALAAELSSRPRHVTSDPAAAWQLACARATPDHLICIAGSFFLAAEMRAAIRASHAASAV
jgi:dihydrofolate synthase / folylpolyglutamate synthase